MSTITITFSECSENHVGMQKIGNLLPVGSGISVYDLEQLEANIPGSVLHRLNYMPEHEPAAVLIIRNGVSLLGLDDVAIYDEHYNLPKDSTYFERKTKRVQNKNARWNLCFADNYQPPDIANGKGTVFAFSQLPQTFALKQGLINLLGPGIMGNVTTAEANYYYDVNKCGIGFHGDSERRKVIGVRLGYPMKLCYRWYHRYQPDSNTFTFVLNSGDIYLMSEKAVGTDWKKSSIWTLRHSAGCDKYTA